MGHRFPMANKSFGQHFLNSPTVINKITSPLPEGTDAILEVGPGPAVLTSYLANYNHPVYVIEMDERFVELLSPVVGTDHIFRQDALLFDWETFLKEKQFKNIWLVSNLPYNVSVPLTLSFLRIPEIKNMTLMYQKEVAQKILPNDPRNAMGSLHAMCFSQFHLNHVVYAPPGAFVPPPKVESQVLSFSRRSSPLIPLAKIDRFEKFLRLVFSQKRKQLGGILKNDWGTVKMSRVLEESAISPQIRAEALNFGDILKIFTVAEAYTDT
jgi:16S rRNA (adenine1518-N6/adenine1519-N6)-dimethyltransferase